jgi:hypothetical protein
MNKKISVCSKSTNDLGLAFDFKVACVAYGQFRMYNQLMRPFSRANLLRYCQPESSEQSNREKSKS